MLVSTGFESILQADCDQGWPIEEQSGILQFRRGQPGLLVEDGPGTTCFRVSAHPITLIFPLTKPR
jgi:hypothetical protein